MYRLIILFIILSLHVKTYAQPLLSINNISGNRCNNLNFSLSFKYDTSNIPITPIIAQLSDSNGLFSSPINIGSTNLLNNGFGNISCIFSGISPGSNYRIRIISSGSSAQGDTSTVFIISVPTAGFSFSPNNVCSGTPITFNNTASSLSGIASYNWTFSGGAGAPPGNATANPTVTFNPGIGNGTSNYTIALAVTDNNGCTASTSQTNALQIKQLPDPSINAHPFVVGNFANIPNPFNPTLFRKCNLIPPHILTVSNLSSTNSTNTNFIINWGDTGVPYNSNISPDSVVKNYGQIGSFTLSTIYTNNLGCTNSKNYQIYIGTNPLIGLPNNTSTTGECVSKTYSFQITNFTNNTPGTTYRVESNDRGIDTMFSHPPPNLYSKTYNFNSCGYTTPQPYPNSFFLRIVATNPCGSSTATFEPIQLSSKPIANINVFPNPACVNTIVNIQNSTIAGRYIDPAVNIPNSIGSCDTTYFNNWTITPSTGWSVISGTLTGFNASNNLQVSFNTPGIYSIRLIIINNLSPCGVDTAIKTICVQPVPMPNFTLNLSPINRCLPITVNIINTSNTLASCGTTTYTWSTIPETGVSFTGGTNANSTNAQLLFNHPGIFTLRLTVTNQCTTLVKDTIVVIKGPPTVALQNNQTYCGQKTLAFTNALGAHRVIFDSVFGENVSYNWSVQPAGVTFTGGTNSFSKFPVILFPQNSIPITYKVMAQITNECGTARDTQEIIILPKPGLPIGIKDTFRCGSGLITVSGTVGLYGTNLVWYSSSGTLLHTGLSFSPNVSTTSSFYVKSIIGSTGCLSDSIPFTVIVYPIPNVAQNPVNATRCGPGDVTLSATVGNNGNTLRWYDAAVNGNLIDTGNQIIRFVSATTTFYVSSYNRTTGCESSGPRLAVNATVNAIPTVNAGAKNQSYCNQNLNVTLTGYSPPLSSSVGTGNWVSIPSGKVNANGTFNPSIAGVGLYSFIYVFTSTNGCINSDTISVSVVNPAFANAGNDTSVCRLNKTFQLNGHPSGGVWSGQKINSVGLFNSDSAGIFKVYYSYGSGTCLTIDSALITVIAPPTPSFTVFDSLCNYQSFNLNATATTTFGSNNFLWAVSNNSGFSNSILNSNSIANPIVTYPDNKTSTNVVYSFKLLVTNDLGCKDSLTKNAVLLRRPTAQFTIPTPFCGPVTIYTNNTSNGNPSLFNWSVTPNSSVVVNTPNQTNTQITFPVNATTSSAIYQVSLVAGIQQNNKSCYDTAQSLVLINQKPSVDFITSNLSGCTPLNVSFTNISDPRNGLGLGSMSFVWHLNNSIVANSQNYINTFINNGVTDTVLQIKLKGTNGFGCADSMQKTVTVYPRPKALFSSSINSSCPPFVVNSSIISLTQFPTANSQYIWQFLNPNKSIRKQVIGIVPPADTISSGLDSIYLRLIAISLNNCQSDTLEMVFRTIANPQASFTISDSLGCHPLSVQFTNTSTPGVSLLWRLGN
ncbi:MAG: PKD domain-containing protein, partial [Bacteroidia bacterium]